MISLSALDVSIAAVLVVMVSLLSLKMQLHVGKRMLIAGIRAVIQLTLLGLVLRWVFTLSNAVWVMVLWTGMLLIAGREVMRRQHRRFTGWWGYGLGTMSMFLSSFTVVILALFVVVRVDPWYTPQYAIPLLGMLLGNTMNGVSLGLDRLTETAWKQRESIEARLILGQTWHEAISDIRRESMRSALMPIINTMSIVGLVSLPGMMTGQILSGALPMDAVKYQIMILFLIAGGIGFGSMAAVQMASRRLFDDRQRLRMDRLGQAGL